MKARQLMIALVAALAAVLAAGTLAMAGGGKSGSAGEKEYRPGKGCGDRNHIHTGPPGNPSNKACPAKAGTKKTGAATRTAAAKKAKKKACGKSKKSRRAGKKAGKSNRRGKATCKKKAAKRKKAARARSRR